MSITNRTVQVPATISDGYSPVWNSSTQSWISSNPSSSIGWSTAIDLDFKSLATQSLSDDGVKNIGGYSWTKINSASDSTAMAITNGSGLVITPIANTNISASTFSAPAIRIPVSSIVPTFSPFMPIRIWLYVSSSNDTANFDETVFGIYVHNASYANNFTVLAFRGYAGSVNGWGGGIIVLNTNIIGTNPSIPQSVNRSGILYFPSGILGGVSTIITGGNVVANAWPSLSSFSICASPTITSSASGALSNASTGNKLVSDCNFFIGALRASSATSYVTTIERFRVDYLPIGL